MKLAPLSKILSCIGFAVAALQAGGQAVAAEPLGMDTLKVGIANNKPWAYRDTDGQVKGVNADIIRAVFEHLGVKNIDYIVGDFGSLIPGLISKRFDVVDSSVVITPARCKLVDFGNPEVSSLDAVIVLKGNPKNVHSFAEVIKRFDVKLGGSRGSQQAKNVLLAGVPDDKMQQFQNTESTISALLANRVDGIVFTAGTARALVSRPEMAPKMDIATPFTGLVDPKTGKNVVSYVAPAFNKDNPKLRDAFNTQLAKLMADGTVAKISAKYGFSADEQVPAGITAASACAE